MTTVEDARDQDRTKKRQRPSPQQRAEAKKAIENRRDPDPAGSAEFRARQDAVAVEKSRKRRQINDAVMPGKRTASTDREQILADMLAKAETAAQAEADAKAESKAKAAAEAAAAAASRPPIPLLGAMTWSGIALLVIAVLLVGPTGLIRFVPAERQIPLLVAIFVIAFLATIYAIVCIARSIRPVGDSA
jgi:hypothetical protein